ncbi:hypothetical protein Moror_5780 [Moniliophthora roreri MCA 2997]|uniref:Uncharacterized protein n=2 Tax=Moniliophthora roreri TaxID=221103 RepID=V2Y6H1_MONRO|nr:hypothetical protein Moror_5780 [Moniliophthora roreri MCA 2997]
MTTLVEQYNCLPLVTEAHRLAEGQAAARLRLCAIVAKYNLSNKFGVRLIHKHFDMQSDEVPVFRDVNIEGICSAIFMGPMKPDAKTVLCGKNFLVDKSGRLVPYEFTTTPTDDPASYQEFVGEFTREVHNSSASDVLGLCTNPKQYSESYTEFELPAIKSTVMVPSKMVPVADSDTSMTTNWIADQEPAPADNCVITRSEKHHGLQCMSTRNGHYKHSSRRSEPKDESFESNEPDDLLHPVQQALRDPLSPLFQVVRTIGVM